MSLIATMIGAAMMLHGSKRVRRAHSTRSCDRIFSLTSVWVAGSHLSCCVAFLCSCCFYFLFSVAMRLSFGLGFEFYTYVPMEAPETASALARESIGFYFLTGGNRRSYDREFPICLNWRQRNSTVAPIANRCI